VVVEDDVPVDVVKLVPEIVVVELVLGKVEVTVVVDEIVVVLLNVRVNSPSLN
jgi:hypothetical protein